MKITIAASERVEPSEFQRMYAILKNIKSPKCTNSRKPPENLANGTGKANETNGTLKITNDSRKDGNALPYNNSYGLGAATPQLCKMGFFNETKK